MTIPQVLIVLIPTNHRHGVYENDMVRKSDPNDERDRVKKMKPGNLMVDTRDGKVRTVPTYPGST